MTSPKAIQIGKDIDNARCTGNWSALPELARRYKKYNPEGTILEQTVLAEVNLIQLLNNTREPIEYHLDHPNHITLENRIDPALLLSIQNQLSALIQLPESAESNQKEFTKIILARTYFETGEYAKVIEIISQLSFEKGQVMQGYGLVLFLQARSIKAMSLELLGHEQAAIQSYEGVVNLLNEFSNVRNKPLIEWSEESLYRANLFASKEGSTVHPNTLLEFIRQYQKITNQQPIDWRIQKRKVITRQSLQTCAQLYRQGQLDLTQFRSDQTQLYTTYEVLLTTTLPVAGQLNQPILDFVEQFANDFELLGTSAYDLRGFVEVLDRASQRTFNSPLITRHLFLALVRLGELEEARQALESYLSLVGLVSYGWREGRRDGKALAQAGGLVLAVPDRPPQPDPIAKTAEKESIEDQLKVLKVAIKMYTNDLESGVDAVEMAEIAEGLVEGSGMASEIYRAIGVAYGLLGCQTFGPELRPKYHEKALSYLEKAVELDSECWENYYQLGLQQAQMRSIGQAVQSITQAIQRHSSHLASWHLLTLLISCPSQGDFRQALKTCTMGLKQAQENPDYDQATQQMTYGVTHALLMHILEGPDVALDLTSRLFSTFRRAQIPELSQAGAHHGMVVAGSLGNLGSLADLPEIKVPEEKHHHHLHLHLFSSSRSKSKNLDSSGNLLDPRQNLSVASFQSTTSVQSILQPNQIPTKQSTRTIQRKKRSDRALSDLWLLTAKIFIKSGRLDEAHKAIEEAESVDWISNPQVWCVLGQILELEGDLDQAQAAYQKALVIDPYDVQSQLQLAILYLKLGDKELAEGLLNVMTKSNGWDCAEAWFYLAEIYKETDRLERTKACLFFALDLESTTPIQPFSILPRFV